MLCMEDQNRRKEQDRRWGRVGDECAEGSFGADFGGLREGGPNFWSFSLG